MPNELPLRERLFGLDPRSLTAFRVCLGLMLCVDAVDRFRDAGALYTDAGALPIGLSNALSRPGLPFHAGGAELAPLWLALLFLSGVALAAGWFTRAAVVVGWLTSVSLQSRNPLVLYGSDFVLRTELWWAFFLPIASVASLDRRAGRSPAPPRTWLTPATFAYTVQIAVLYFATYVLKTGRTWHDGTAGWYAVQIDAWTGPVGVALREWPTLLKAGTYVTLTIEAIGPWLLFLPWRTAYARLLVIACYFCFHLGLELALQIGWFPWVSMICWLPLIPAELWDRTPWQITPSEAPPASWLSRLADAATVASLTLVCWWNLATWMPDQLSVPQPLRRWALNLRLDQKWDMYAPNPAQTDGWFVVDLTLTDDSHVDPATGRKPSRKKPADVPGMYGSSRWNKFMHGLWEPGWADRREPYLDWVCRTYNASQGAEGRATTAALLLMKEKSPAPGQPQNPVEQVRLATRDCAP